MAVELHLITLYKPIDIRNIMNRIAKTTVLRVVPVALLLSLCLIPTTEPHTAEELPKHSSSKETPGDDDPDLIKDRRLRAAARKFCKGMNENSQAGKLGYAITDWFWSPSKKSPMEASTAEGDIEAEKEGERKGFFHRGTPDTYTDKHRLFVMKMRGEFEEDTRRRLLIHGPAGHHKAQSIDIMESDQVTVLRKESVSLLGKTNEETMVNIANSFEEADTLAQRTGKRVVLFYNDMQVLNRPPSPYQENPETNNPLNVLGVLLDQYEENKNIGFAGSLNSLNGLPDGLISRFDSTNLSRYAAPNGNQRCTALAYNFLKVTQGGDFLSQKNMQTWVNDTHGFSHAEVEGVARDSKTNGLFYRNGTITPDLVDRVINEFRLKNKSFGRSDNTQLWYMQNGIQFFGKQLAQVIGAQVVQMIIMRYVFKVGTPVSEPSGEAEGKAE